jgi:hypothetical protein
MLRKYFTDLFPYMREAVRKFNLEGVWDKVYSDVVMGDYEMDRLALFLDRLYKEDRTLFVSFLSYVTKEVLDRFHEPKENLTWFIQEQKNRISMERQATSLFRSVRLRGHFFGWRSIAKERVECYRRRKVDSPAQCERCRNRDVAATAQEYAS